MTKTIFEIRETIEGLKKERDRLIEREKKLSLFSLFDSEDKETVRPEYDFERYQEEIEGLNKRIRNLSKKALSYIVNTKVAECGDMTILEALLYVDELGEKEERLYAMSTHQEMERKDNPKRAEYEYINYDKSRVEEEYKKTKAELARIKMCVDFYIYELSSDYET
ncbi:MAG: hypothetical protein ACI4NB_02775 [Candidatus Ornithospirochaeta sp.]